MVKIRVQMAEYALKRQKRRILFCERHGIGDTTIKEKAILKKMERLKELRNEAKT